MVMVIYRLFPYVALSQDQTGPVKSSTINMINIILSLLPLALAAPTPSTHGGTKVALPPRSAFAREDGTVDAHRFLTHLNYTMTKYNSDVVLPSLPHASRHILKNRADEPLTDMVDTGEDISYFGPGTVGASTPQDFTFIFDTG